MCILFVCIVFHSPAHATDQKDLVFFALSPRFRFVLQPYFVTNTALLVCATRYRLCSHRAKDFQPFSRVKIYVACASVACFVRNNQFQSLPERQIKTTALFNGVPFHVRLALAQRLCASDTAFEMCSEYLLINAQRCSMQFQTGKKSSPKEMQYYTLTAESASTIDGELLEDIWAVYALDACERSPITFLAALP